MDLVYTTTMLTQGGRNGQVQTEDGSWKLKLAVPKEMGGDGNGPNPEQLFAAAFATCFEHSVRHIAKATSCRCAAATSKPCCRCT